jgi:hypothetical protein
MLHEARCAPSMHCCLLDQGGPPGTPSELSMQASCPACEAPPSHVPVAQRVFMHVWHPWTVRWPEINMLGRLANAPAHVLLGNMTLCVAAACSLLGMHQFFTVRKQCVHGSILNRLRLSLPARRLACRTYRMAWVAWVSVRGHAWHVCAADDRSCRFWSSPTVQPALANLLELWCLHRGAAQAACRPVAKVAVADASGCVTLIVN